MVFIKEYCLLNSLCKYKRFNSIFCENWFTLLYRFLHVLSILLALWKYLFDLSHITGSLYNTRDFALVHEAVQKNVRIPQHISDERSGTSSAGTTWKIIPPLIFNPYTHVGVISPISRVALTSNSLSLFSLRSRLGVFYGRLLIITHRTLARQHDLCPK